MLTGPITPSVCSKLFDKPEKIHLKRTHFKLQIKTQSKVTVKENLVGGQPELKILHSDLTLRIHVLNYGSSSTCFGLCMSSVSG